MTGDYSKDNMRKDSLDAEDLHLYRDLLLTVVKARMTMDTASARAEILLNIFDVTVEHLGTEETFVERCIGHLELDMIDARDAPEPLREATANMARAIWTYRTNPTSKTDQDARDEFERWETVYQQTIGEPPADAYMDIENARCLSEPDYYSAPPLPYITRARARKGSHN